ncbi:MAG: helix-turn-helix transcriptional regulator [Spirochaetales bacterium]|nr:helix-turn-helix transcriptional regulator [Spirochaetales bacterium]
MTEFRRDCQTHFVHDDIIRKVRETIPAEEDLYVVADFFKMFGDATRLKILQALAISEMCVCDLSELLHISQSAMSHQLKTLRQVNLVKFRKEGKVVFYSLKDEHVNQIIETGIQHVTERE